MIWGQQQSWLLESVYGNEMLTDYKIRHLYKYRAWNEKNLERVSRIFTHNEIFLASPNQFNDPFDCRAGHSLDGTREQQEKYFEGVIRRNEPGWSNSRIRKEARRYRLKIRTDPNILETLNRNYLDIIAEVGICSLSEVWNNPLMWSHYADSHKGFCVEYLDGNTDGQISKALKVEYQKELPVWNPVLDDAETRLNKTVLTKSIDWKYEQEWRFVDHEKGPGIQSVPGRLLTGVVFGAKMPKEHKELIRKWTAKRSQPIRYYQAALSETAYQIERQVC